MTSRAKPVDEVDCFRGGGLCSVVACWASKCRQSLPGGSDSKNLASTKPEVGREESKANGYNESHRTRRQYKQADASASSLDQVQASS